MPSAEAAISGLSIKFEEHPYIVRVGENFKMTVRVVNESGGSVSGYIRTQLYGNKTLFTYPTNENGSTVNLNYGGATSNQISVSLENGENNLYEFWILVDPTTVPKLESGASVYLRARISAENGSSLAPSDTDTIWLIPKQGAEELAPIKFTIGITLSATIVLYLFLYRDNFGEKFPER